MLNLVNFLVLLILLIYSVLILFYRAGWLMLQEYKLNRNHIPLTKVSILIPARNEAENIGSLLEDLKKQVYPANLIEIIVIDDHSTDRTASIVASYPSVKCIALAEYTSGEQLNAFKKKAIEIGIGQSSGELIITTDADCSMSNYWLLSIVCYYESYHDQLITSPVLFTNDSSWIQTFQSIDFMTMQGITAALSRTKTGSMCNGANLAYTRKAFEAVKGFQGIDHLASGDDMMLMYKIEKQFPKQTSYLKCKDAIVFTAPMPTFSSFLEQRIRWASKAGKLQDSRVKRVLSLVYLFNLIFPALLIMSFFYPKMLITFLLLWIAKTAIEFMLLYPVSSFFDKKSALKYFFLLQMIHIPYILYAGIKGQFGKYQWKGRSVK